MDIRFLLLQSCFFVSGFAALLYETVWTREFAFIFGTSELAVAAVLSAYMAGLAAGAALAAHIAPRLRRPVLVYGLFELGIAAGALAVPWGTRLLMALYVQLFGGLDTPPETMGLATALFHLAGAFAVLVPCTALMGATLPLLARHAVHSDEQIGPRIGLLYAVNTAGAISGAVAAAFFLLPAIGLRQTVHVGAAANLLVFASAALLARTTPASPPSEPERVRSRHWILPLIAVSGAISFVYEVLWTRLLGYLLGGSTAAFATMLASFLLGIALGSAAASRLARRREAAIAGFALAQLGTALSVWGAFHLSDSLPTRVAHLATSAGHLTAGALACVPVLLPFTLCIGATFPFAVRIFAGSSSDAAPASARVYAWNTLGSIVGSVGAGFWLLPTFGFVGTLSAAVLGNAALAALSILAGTRATRDEAGATSRFPRPFLRSGVLVAAAAIALAIWAKPPRSPDHLLSIAVRTGRPFPGRLDYVGVGRSATVTLIDTGQEWRIATNGLPESAIERPEAPRSRYQSSRWLALLPILARPEAKDLLLIGLGGGNTLSAITPGLRSVDLIELEPEVVRANALVAAQRIDGDPLADPRVHLHYGDARGSLLLADAHYDGIVSQPSHPWTAGASHLYTREFFEMASSRLRPNGVFVQWIGRTFVNESLLRALLATLHDVFPNVELYQPEGGALLMIASRAPLDTIANAKRALAGAPVEFGRVGIHDVEDVAAARTLDADDVGEISRGALRNTDDQNHLAFSAGRLGDPTEQRRGIKRLFSEHDPLARSLTGLDPSKLVRRLMAGRHFARAKHLAAALPAPRRALANGWIQYEMNRPESATRAFRKALEADPRSRAARIGLAIAHFRDADLASLPEPVAAVVTGRQLAADGDWRALRALDSQLANWQPGDLLYPEAVRLRALWRVRSGGAEQGREALALIDPLLARGGRPRDYLQRARAAALADEQAWAWAGLAPLVRRAASDGQPADVAQQALAIASKLTPIPGSQAIVVQLRRLARRGAR